MLTPRNMNTNMTKNINSTINPKLKNTNLFIALDTIKFNADKPEGPKKINTPLSTYVFNKNDMYNHDTNP
ncbi:hypothetical protein DAMA08_021090 (mitochondrion) [Martiniozyma asiatica (nom. inval.)]|nr:hypothetical protein DAMA08_021090 [Martiniozyma asiatica]